MAEATKDTETRTHLRKMRHLVPFFCNECGNRLGWKEDDGTYGVEEAYGGYCEECAGPKDAEIEAEIKENETAEA